MGNFFILCIHTPGPLVADGARGGFLSVCCCPKLTVTCQSCSERGATWMLLLDRVIKTCIH